MKEKILNTFKDLGFEMEEMEELGYGFEYEGIHYLWITNEDEDFLSIAVPAFFDKEDANELEFYKAMDNLNSSLKYIKVNELNNSMWMFYERELFDDEDFEDLLPHIILHLEQGIHCVRDLYSDNTAESEKSNDELINDSIETENRDK